VNNYVFAQASSDSVLKSYQIKPVLEINTQQTKYLVNSQISIRGRIINLTDVDLHIVNAELILPGEYQAARGETNSEIKDFIKMELKELQLKPGAEYPVNFTIPYQNLAWYTSLLNGHLLTFQPRAYEFLVIVNYRIATLGKSSVQKAITLDVEAPMSSLIWGGIIGSLLLAIFLSAYKYLRATEANKLKAILVEAVKLFTTGAITALILVILIYRYKEIELPINITVNDFYGGVVLGLFTYTLGDWLYKKLREGKQKEGQIQETKK
jgi:hypothetical protein